MRVITCKPQALWFTMCMYMLSQVVCQASYAYSLLMRANKLKTAAVRITGLCVPHYDSVFHVHVQILKKTANLETARVLDP